MAGTPCTARECLCDICVERRLLPSERHRQYHSLWCYRQMYSGSAFDVTDKCTPLAQMLFWVPSRQSFLDVTGLIISSWCLFICLNCLVLFFISLSWLPCLVFFLMSFSRLSSFLILVTNDKKMNSEPSQAELIQDKPNKINKWGGDMREAQVDFLLSVSYSRVWPHRWAV